MALLRMQLHYVEELFETGMIDEAEHHSMADPIDKKTRHLEIVGPVWRPPPPKAVLRSLPLIASLSEPSFRRIWEAGALREFRSGQVIWTATDLVRRTACAQGPGAFVVLSGVVKRVYIRPDGTRREYFQSAGGVVGVLLCSTGSKLPGTEIAIAEGNTLGKGPVVFHVPQPYVKTILVRAAQGDGEMNRIVEELLRLSAAYVVESMQPDMVETVSNHMAAVMEPAAAAQDGDDGTPLPASMQQTPPPSGGPPGRSPLYRQSSGGPLQRRTSSQQGLGGVSLERRSMMHPGVAPATTGATGAAPLPSGPGLVSVKSVGMNLAAMMQDIAQLEYDELDDTTTAEEEKAELEAARTRASQRSIRAGRQSIAAAAALEADDEDPLQPRRASSPSRRAVQFQVETSRSRNLSLRRASLAAAAAEHAPQVAADLALEMRRCLHYALVIRLTPGESMVQTSHVVLVAGELSPERGSAAERCFAQDVSAPWVLPWMWNTSQLCNACAIVPMVPQLKWTAGPEGATVVVCHQADGSVPPWVEEWHDAKSHADAKDKLTSFPLGADGGIASSGASVSDQGDAGLGRAASTPGGSEQGSLMGSAAAAMGRELGSMMSFLRRNKAETPRKMNAR